MTATAQQAPTLDPLAQTINEAFAPAGHVWERLANSTGFTNGLTKDPALFWQRPAGFQIFEFVFFFALYRFFWQNWAQDYISRNVTLAYRQSKPLFVLDKILGGILAACFLLQIYIKATRPNPFANLFWLIMPCHVITACWAFVLLQPPSRHNYALCKFIAVMMAMSSWGAVAATAWPDFSDQRFKFEQVVFFIHHGIMLVAPHYWAAVHGVPGFSWPLFFTYCCGCTFFNYLVYTPLAFLVGVNINYNMYPHQALARKMPLVMGSVWYRFFVPIGLWVWGFCYLWLLHGLNRLLYLTLSGTSPPVQVSPETTPRSSPSPPPTEPSASPSKRASLSQQDRRSSRKPPKGNKKAKGKKRGGE